MIFEDLNLLFIENIPLLWVIVLTVSSLAVYVVSAFIVEKFTYMSRNVHFFKRIVWFLINALIAGIPFYFWIFVRIIEGEGTNLLIERITQLPLILAGSGIVTLIYFVICDKLDIEVQQAVRFDIHVKKSGGFVYRHHIPTEFSKELPIRAGILFALGSAAYFLLITFGNGDVNSFTTYLAFMFTWMISGFYGLIIMSGNFDTKLPRIRMFYRMISSR